MEAPNAKFNVLDFICVAIVFGIALLALIDEYFF